MPNCQQCARPFAITDEDRHWFQKFQADPDTLCFDCRQKWLLSFRNERSLYRRKCDFTGDDIISIYSPEKPYKVYQKNAWYGDGWDGLEYGRDFDESRPFFDQLKELQLQVPRLALIQVKCENSDYCNMCVGNKNCYLVFGGDFNRDVLYGTLCMRNVNSADLDFSNDNELCYFMGETINSYGCQFAFDSKNCRDCFFVSDCFNCSDCILCVNLTNKSYCIDNQQYSKAEYFEKKREMLTGSYVLQQKWFARLMGIRRTRIVKYANSINGENCTGDYLKNSRNCHNCYNTSNSEDMRNIIFASKSKDCFDAGYLGDGSQQAYYSVGMLNSYNIRSSYFIIDSSNIEYCEQIYGGSRDLFGCVGLRRKQYCILNKQYSAEDYKKLRERIIGHMRRTGEYQPFLRKDLSCFGYNESTAYDYYTMEKEAAVAQGFKWAEEKQRDFMPQNFSIPDHTKDVPATITKEALACADCGKNFKITPQELEFYQKNTIPIPRQCHDCRHKIRSSLKTPLNLWSRQCANCSAPIQTTYSPDRLETVYCEKCYLKVVY